MKMIFNLVKKDFMLIRKTVALIMLVVIGFPIFFAFQFEAEEAFDSMGTVIFGALAFMCTFMIYHSASLEELKYNGPYCLVATPYSRKENCDRQILCVACLLHYGLHRLHYQFNSVAC